MRFSTEPSQEVALILSLSKDEGGFTVRERP